MPEFQFPATLTVDAPSEAAAQTLADHAIEDADQYLSGDYKLERNGDASWRLTRSLLPKPRFTVELTTEGWQVKDNVRDIYGANAYGIKDDAQGMADLCNRQNAAREIDADEGQGRR